MNVLSYEDTKVCQSKVSSMTKLKKPGTVIQQQFPV